MTKFFENKVALITGGSSGIGKATALTFARQGASVLIADLSAELGEQTAEEITQSGGKAHFVRTDVGQAGQVQKMVQEALEKFGRLDFCVNSAGIEGERTRTDKYSEKMFDQVMEVNVKGVWLCMQAQLPMLMKNGGCIVNIASVAGVQGFPGHCAYSASKHAVIGLTKTAAVEFVRFNIRVNAVCPGFTQTPMVENAIQEDAAYAEKVVNSIPMRRLASAQEIADVVVFLCSEQSTFITGQAMVVDGGITAI
jgi:NAD(P)-dependent dehydrogenase (short-subunit alcohol dehydrogenase family)